MGPWSEIQPKVLDAVGQYVQTMGISMFHIFSEWTDTLPPQRGQGNAFSACRLCFYQNMIWPLPTSGFSFLCVGVRVYNKKLPPAEKPESEGLFGSFLRLRVFHVCFSFSQQFRLSRLLSCVLNKAA